MKRFRKWKMRRTDREYRLSGSDTTLIRPRFRQDHSTGLMDMNSPMGELGGLKGDTKGCGKTS
ncbi:hypothetical protein DY000_02030867 [Brassica cretica]|uniref:Uncharacterized protein n=1 Tax=Brassica cretica TaxID=69181 RepID=A0ABQ7DUG1_BRACR|nr:hypothetical protein DY000_02030867 [Brassica cretica]